MSNSTRRFMAGITLLLLGLSLTTAVTLTAPRIVRAAGVRYVAPTAQGIGNCSSWANACTLQTALTNAVSGDEIWVKAGVHYPGTNRTDSFRIQRNVQLYGGFAGTETARDQRNWVANPTILSGDIGTVGIKGDNAYHVVYVDGVTNGPITGATVIDGFTITAGNANSTTWPDNVGGGLYCNGEHSGRACSPTLTNVTFSGNTATDAGGGMFNNGRYSGNSSPTLTNVTFSGNSATYGGGMYNYGPYSGTSSPTLTNVTFSGNSASNRGGGMYNYCNGGISSPTLTNVTFSGNTATNSGGGIYNYGYNGTSSPTLSNCILWGNTASEGPQMHNASASPTVSYSLIQGGCPSGATCGAGMLYVDPLFVNAAGGNLRLRPTSPAIDAGNNAAVPPGVTTDLDGRPRFIDIPTVPDTGYGTPPIVDMGAYEAQYVDVALGKAVSPQTVLPGQAITFTLTLSNPGDFPATGIVVTDTLPSFLGSVSFTSSLLITDTGYTPPYVWQVQDLAPGQSGVITITGVLTVPLAAGTYTNTAVIAATGDLLAENNTAVVTFTVPNYAPSFTSAPVTTATQDAPYTYAVTATDPDLAYGDALTLTAPTRPAWLTLVDHGNGTATLSGTPSNADVGDHAVLLQVTDSGGLTDTQAFTVTVANVNEAPSFTSAPVTTATQDAPHTYAVTATDPDLAYGDALTLTAPTLPGWLTLVDHGNGTATLSGTPSNADVGDHAVLLQVTDSGGLTDTQAFMVTVANINEAPSFTSAPVTTAIQDAPYTYAVTATDPDLVHGDALTLTAPTLPGWLTLVDHGNGTATLSGTPSNADVGEHAVVLQVTDSGGLTNTQAFTVTVANVNEAPSFTSTPVLTAIQGAPYTYAVTATDPDLVHGDALTLTAPTLPGWLTLVDHGNGTATLSGTPTEVGEYQVVLRVTDWAGAFTEQAFTITVAEKPLHYIFLPLVLRSAP